jgi:hypothetical protein
MLSPVAVGAGGGDGAAGDLLPQPTVRHTTTTAATLRVRMILSL